MAVKYEQDITVTMEAMEKFREAYPSVRVTVYANCMVYKTAPGFADDGATRANKLIKDMELPLVATATTFYTKDSFTIQKSSVCRPQTKPYKI